jgi:hypothetical protein
VSHPPNRALLVAALGGLLGASSACTTSSGSLPAAVCTTGVSDSPAVTSTTVDATMTLATFTAECNQRGGQLETEPHCGGLNGCRGVSWDTGTATLTEHTCRGTNTCAGYSCIICN